MSSTDSGKRAESLKYFLIRCAMVLPASVRRGLAWLTQARFTVGVSAVVLDGSDRVLLLRHRFREQQGWELPGGFVEHGENLETALRRELKEETGYDIDVVSLLSADVSESHHLDVCYRARLRNGELRLDNREILEARFFAYEELPPELRRDDRINIDHVVSPQP